MVDSIRRLFRDKTLVAAGLLTTLFHCLDDFVRRQNRMCQKRVIDQGRRITVAPYGMLWPGRRIFYHSDLETLLQQFAQVRFDAHVGEHSAKNDLTDLAFAKL